VPTAARSVDWRDTMSRSAAPRRGRSGDRGRGPGLGLGLRRLGLAALLALAAAGCGRAAERPLSGAPPGGGYATPGLPPTLSVTDSRLRPSPSPLPATQPSPLALAAAAPEPSPGAGPTGTASAGAESTATAAASAGPTPAVSPATASQPPIVRTIAPAAGGQVDGGAPVTISAVLVGRGADLAEASLTIDGATAGSVDRQSARQWAISASQTLPPGQHTARVLVTDTNGGRGGYTWQFTVAGAAPPKPATRPSPSP
jgi:hypothetical protein